MFDSSSTGILGQRDLHKVNCVAYLKNLFGKWTKSLSCIKKIVTVPKKKIRLAPSLGQDGHLPGSIRSTPFHVLARHA